MRLFNSLSKKIEKFEPMKIKAKNSLVKVYTCGPTVYDYVHIGNWRTYTLSDLLVRSLQYLGYKTKYVMNITDVGHLVSDADEGEDKLEKGARREGKTAWEVADFYLRDFLAGFKKMNFAEPDVFCKATEHIKEQIDLIGLIEKKGLVYRIDDGMYFDTAAFEKKGFVYGALSSLEKIREGARVELNLQKKNARDFALWKFAPKKGKRDMEWESPWGVGFPGWHIECSAMSMKYLGEQFDIHVGGEDLKSIHHPNEIAQAEGATGKKPFVKYWMHGAFLQIDGGKMSKSLGNIYTLADLAKKGFEPLDLRYFYLTGHYRKPLNFTWEALEGAKRARNRLRQIIVDWRGKTKLGCTEFEERFEKLIADDLDMPKALALVWEMVKSNNLDSAKKMSLLKFDKVLGLGLDRVGDKKKIIVPEIVKKMLEKREKLREQKKYVQADLLRKEIVKMGYEVEDGDDQSIIVLK